MSTESIDIGERGSFHNQFWFQRESIGRECREIIEEEGETLLYFTAPHDKCRGLSWIADPGIETEEEMDAQKQYQIDLGNLMALDPNHHFPSIPSSREELVVVCLQKGTELAQALADALFTLPATEDVDGPIVKLPPPTTRLPRQKHNLGCKKTVADALDLHIAVAD